jgi:hypothetical protein
VLQGLADRVKTLGGDWTQYSVVGSFLLYVFGYLALRFHLTAIGVGTDLAVLDERYLFTGARFVVYLVTAIPSLLLVALPLALVVWGISKIESVRRTATRWWLGQPITVAILGIVFSVAAIQFVMRQCFLVSDLLLSRTLPTGPAWLIGLLLDDRLMPLYFMGLVVACAVPLFILFALRNVDDGRELLAVAKGLLGFLVGVQVLLLPVNYGVLVVDKSLPRVAAIGETPMPGGADGDEAWLVWEGQEGMTFLTRSSAGQRALLTLPKSEVTRTEIVGFDRIVPTLVARDGGQTR